ncbi:MAG: hypothetical protein GXY44_03585 [Phycisphaerales bacterium]|nr:hypothetical protein [Phycisphaerales bacterium]
MNNPIRVNRNPAGAAHCNQNPKRQRGAAPQNPTRVAQRRAASQSRKRQRGAETREFSVLDEPYYADPLACARGSDRPGHHNTISECVSRGTVGLLTLLLALTIAGCQEKEIGPKFADHQAAHTPRYHPSVNRAGGTTSAPSDPATATQPDDEVVLKTIAAGHGPIGSPILFVNGDTISVHELLEPIIDQLRQQAVALSPGQYQYAFLRTVQRELDSQISRLLVYQEAKKEYREQAKEAVEKETDRLLKATINHRFGGSQVRYETHLKSLGLTLDDRKEFFRRQVMVLAFLRERFQPLLTIPPRREMMKYYETHMDQFRRPARAEMFLIDVPYEKLLGKSLAEATPSELADARVQARRRLEEARAELDSGIAFAEVAKTYSLGIRRSLGGDWGEIVPGALTGRWAKAAETLFTLQEEQVSEIVETDQSMFIVKCGKYTPEQRVSFEEAQEQIITRIQDEQNERLTQNYIIQLLNRATISQDQRLDFLYAVYAASPKPKEDTMTTAPEAPPAGPRR